MKMLHISTISWVSAACLAMVGWVTSGQGDDAPQASSPAAVRFQHHLADYDAEPRLPNGRVDVDTLAARLKELRVTTYYWLIGHTPTDWDDLKLFLPKAAAAKLEVWVYLLPPSESPPYCKVYSEPFRLDYPRWAEEIARLSLKHPNLTAWVIDDFFVRDNPQFFTPAYIRQMQARAHQLNPRLAFLPQIYFGQVTPRFVQQYRAVIDGVVVAYPRDRCEIDCAEAVLSGATAVPGQLRCPWATPSSAGDFAAATVSAKVLPGDRQVIRFRERDDSLGDVLQGRLTRLTAGHHFKQLLIDDTVVWEKDVADGKHKWGDVMAERQLARRDGKRQPASPQEGQRRRDIPLVRQEGSG